MSDPDAPVEKVHDLIGVGFGPSNISLAIAVEECNARAAGHETIEAAFFERQPCFGWHRGMLIPGTTIQVSFLKDLVTLRNPASDYSFVAYLHSQGRLVDFINHKTLFPLRLEFHDYLEWAAGRLSHLVSYGSQVVDVRAVTGDEVVDHFEVVVRRGRHRDRRLTTVRARNVILAVGLEMNLPQGARLGDRVWHNADLLHRVRDFEATGTVPRRFVVVGAGQSAAETVDHLHRSFAGAEICAVFSRYGYTPSDDSPFANRIFDPEAVDHFYAAPPEVKRRLFDYHRNTNYSVVNLDLIQELYRRAYLERLTGGVARLRVMNAFRVVEVRHKGAGLDVRVEFMPTGSVTELDADVLVYATGYRPRDALGVLGSAGGLCRRDGEGRLRVTRDYRVETTSDCRGGIYLQGGTEHSHGIASSLLSTVAVRAGEILQSILTRSGRDRKRRRALSVL